MHPTKPPRPPTVHHVHLDAIHVHLDATLHDAVARLHTKVDLLLAKGAQMATKADFDSLRADVNDSTNKIAARIDALIAQIAAGGMSATDEEAVLAELRVASEALKALGADPNNPVPDLPPEA